MVRRWCGLHNLIIFLKILNKPSILNILEGSVKHLSPPIHPYLNRPMLLKKEDRFQINPYFSGNRRKVLEGRMTLKTIFQTVLLFLPTFFIEGFHFLFLTPPPHTHTLDRYFMFKKMKTFLRRPVPTNPSFTRLTGTVGSISFPTNMVIFYNFLKSHFSHLNHLGLVSEENITELEKINFPAAIARWECGGMFSSLRNHIAGYTGSDMPFLAKNSCLYLHGIKSLIET